MKIQRAFLTTALLGCSVVFASEHKELARVWSAPNLSVQDRAAAVNRAFTNGTPMSVVVAALGTNFVRFAPISTVQIGPGPKSPPTHGLRYGFGKKAVFISTTASVTEDPLYGRFISAGYTLEVIPLRTNQPPNGQPDGAANGSQPIRSETNLTPTAAGSRR
jgi:hypothetical protein